MENQPRSLGEVFRSHARLRLFILTNADKNDEELQLISTWWRERRAVVVSGVVVSGGGVSGAWRAVQQRFPAADSDSLHYGW